jgi:hypothetical protein
MKWHFLFKHKSLKQCQSEGTNERSAENRLNTIHKISGPLKWRSKNCLIEYACTNPLFSDVNVVKSDMRNKVIK